jgi:hypothetical protein
VLCGSVDERRAGKYMAEVRTSSQSERPCAAIEETRTASADAGGSKDPGQRKVHSLIDKVYAPANLAEAWRHVRDNKGGAGIDGLSIAAFADREEERLAALHRKLRDRSYRPSPVKRVGIPKPDGGLRRLGIPGPHGLAGLWPDWRSPGSRARSVRTCQGLRPRRAGRALAMARPPVLPSVQLTTSAPGKTLFRGSMAGLCVPLSTLRPGLAARHA